jgi:hypothetical protein
VAWQLEDAGYRVLVQAWDFVAGSHWTSRMRDGITGAEHTLAILSRAYLASEYGQAEWQAAYRADPQGLRRKLIPVRVEDCDRPDLLGEVVSFDLFGLTAEAARQRLLDTIRHTLAGRAKPTTPPAFPTPTPPSAPPAASEPAFPGPPAGGKAITATRVATINASKEAHAAAVAVSPDGHSLAVAPGGAVAGGGNTVRVFDTATWRERLALRQHWSGLAHMNAVAFSPHGLFLTTGGREWRGTLSPTGRAIVQNWSAGTGRRYNRTAYGDTLGDTVCAIAYSPDSGRLATSGMGSAAQVWQASRTDSLIFNVAHGDTVNGVVFSPDGRWLATASADKTARLWDTRTGHQHLMLTHEYHVWGVAFSPDGNRLATASTPLYVWDAHTGEELRRLWTEPESRNNLVHSVAFSSNGRWLAAAGGDGTARIWNPDTGAQLLKIDHGSPVRVVAFSSDSRWLVSSSDDGKVNVWQLDEGSDG